ncbi:hypothetical protein HYW19_02555 [Candidatus Woesearchaeota archaeon]|nr:hypothetical protein [Candidatus Woesearchaeota archaeon]
MADDDYDLMPHRQINELRGLVQDLKNKVDRASPKELIESMDSLTKSIDSLMALFKQAADEMKYEEKEEILSGGSEHKAMNDKLDKIMEQNKIIADGMVAISDMVRDFTGKQRKQQAAQAPKPQQFQPQPSFQPSMNAPSFQPSFQPQFNAPPPMPAPRGMQQGLMEEPPLPDFEEDPRKKGLFGRFKK